MKKVTINNTENVAIARAEMSDPSSWIAQEVANNSWGLSERWVVAALDEQGQPIEPEGAIDVRQVTEDGPDAVLRTEYKLPATYTIQIVDLDQDYGYLLEKCYANRRAEYPPQSNYLDGVVKNDQAQIDKYISDCQAVKAKYPKP